MKRKILVLIAFVLLASVQSIYAQDDKLVEKTDVENAEYKYFMYDAFEKGYTSHRSDILTPDYYVFSKVEDLTSANELMDELGILENIQEWAGRIYVIPPIADEYGETDLEYFESLVKREPIKNIKVIGIDEGATFVNNYLSQKCNYVAGMLLIGGEMEPETVSQSSVPVYLSNSTKTTIAFYKKANQVQNESDNENYVLHTNNTDSLKSVAVSKNNESKAEAFSNAWDSVFSKNYRYHNSEGEFYNLPILNESKDILTLEYELVEVPIFEDLNIQYNEMIHQSVSNMDGNDYAWFEYIPKQTLNCKEQSVPLVITIHGNQNDPRLQGDTTGWPELAAKENFMVISPEYQTAKENGYFTQPQNTNVYGTVDGLGEEGIMNLIKDLQVKYPQIDPTRIYVTGLSQGGAMTSLLGIQYSDVFAAAASVSGVNVYGQKINQIVSEESVNETAYLYICGDHDWFQMIPVDGSCELAISSKIGLNIWEEGTATDIFPALQAYQKINNLKVSSKDMELNPYYGIELENQKWTKLGSKDMLEGQLSNDKGVVMQLAAVKDLAHWNYKPEAKYIWDFFTNYQRDIETGDLIYVNEEETPVKPEPKPPVEEEKVEGETIEKETPQRESNKTQEIVQTDDQNSMFPFLILAMSSILIFIITKNLFIINREH